MKLYIDQDIAKINSIFVFVMILGLALFIIASFIIYRGAGNCIFIRTGRAAGEELLAVSGRNTSAHSSRVK